MAENSTSATEKQSDSSPTAGPSKPGGMLLKLIALLFVIAVILAECLVAYFCLPSSDGTAVASAPAAKQDHAKAEKGEHAKAEKGEKGKAEKGKKGESATEGKEKKEKEEDVDPTEQIEIDLGQFSVTSHQPSSATTMRIEFQLSGTITAQDKEDFEKLLKANHHRFREQVLVILRDAQTPDLVDAQLGLIKRQILEKTNALLGKPLLRAIIVSDFSYMEQ